MSLFDKLFHLAYSPDLHQHLKGRATDCEGYHGGSIYQLTSFAILGVSLLFMLNFYYGLFNNPRFTHRRIWALNILAACGLIGLLAYFSAASGMAAGKHCEELHFALFDCLLFAFTEMIYTAVVCLIVSLLFKWKSISNKKIPF
ncbi:hypothetical protein [Taibaiella helva]|uniref:hypothetical protein n=1 Tax=Taibaiella helva TaxID=2301235 RepID=UPI000E56F518|nr:hypothetical protein [Taibaiella helva]